MLSITFIVLVLRLHVVPAKTGLNVYFALNKPKTLIFK